MVQQQSSCWVQLFWRAAENQQCSHASRGSSRGGHVDCRDRSSSWCQAIIDAALEIWSLQSCQAFEEAVINTCISLLHVFAYTSTADTAMLQGSLTVCVNPGYDTRLGILTNCLLLHASVPQLGIDSFVIMSLSIMPECGG